MKSIPIQFLTLVNMFIDSSAYTTVSQASLVISQLIFLNFKMVPGCYSIAFRRDNLDHETPLKFYNSLKMISDARPKILIEHRYNINILGGVVSVYLVSI